MATKIDPKLIRTDLGTQIRVDRNEEAVREYAELMEHGVAFPPLLVFFDGSNNQFILADGFHRLAAHCRVKPNDLILVEQRLGNVEDALWAAITANQSHGIRRTNNDKRNAIKQALLHRKGINKSDRQIAEDAGVHHVTVGTVRKEMVLSGEIHQMDSRIVQRGNQAYVQNISGINANRNDTELPQKSIPVNTSRINFGGPSVPEGATCKDCRYFEDGQCLTGETGKKFGWSQACDGFAVQVEASFFAEEFLPPDYENAKPLGRRLKQSPKPRLHQNRDLKNSMTVTLPLNNASRFAVELKVRLKKSYLIECLTALKLLLDDKDEGEEEYKDD